MTISNLKLLIKTLILEAKLNTKTVYTYHISDNANMSDRQIQAGVYSPKFENLGLFTAPLNAIKNSWASWAANKGRFGATEGQKYKNVTLYKLALPKWVLDQAKKEHEARAEESIEQHPDSALGAWGWDIETFIPKELLQHVHIAGKKTGKVEEFFKRITDNQNYRGGQKTTHETQYTVSPTGEIEKTVTAYSLQPASFERILQASDESLKLLNKQELENVVDKLEYFLSPDWIEQKIKKYAAITKYKARAGSRIEREIYSRYLPDLRKQQEQTAEKERSENRETAERKLSIARNLLKTKS
jgi:hypothetical protein